MTLLLSRVPFCAAINCATKQKICRGAFLAEGSWGAEGLLRRSQPAENQVTQARVVTGVAVAIAI